MDEVNYTDLSDGELIDTCGPFVVGEITPLREVVVNYIEWAINRLDGDKNEAARFLEINRKTVYNKMRGRNI